MTPCHLSTNYRNSFMDIPILDRFWNKVNKDTESDCWEWTASTQKGYGTFWTGKQLIRAHRFSWCIHYSDVNELHVLHHCDNRLCVRPDHLFTGTNLDNIKDRMMKGRSGVNGLFGEKHSMAKLTDVDVINIRRSYPEIKQIQLANEYGITQGQISAIIRRASWKHI